MVKNVNKISKEFIVDVEGIVSVPEKPIESTSHKLEIQARKVFCISKAVAQLPLNLEDTARSERELVKIVKENRLTLYTMPCWDDHHYSNSFDIFIQGEEIISGGQRIHDAELLTKQVIECGIDVNTLSSYIDSSGDTTFL